MDLKQGKIIKLIGMVIGIILFASLVVGMSYAWISWQSGNIPVEGSSVCFDIIYTKGKNIDNESVILFDKKTIINDNKITVKNGMAITNVVASISRECNITGDITINLNVTSLNDAYTEAGESTGAFNYAIVKYDSSLYTDITMSALSGKSFDIIKSDSITSTGSITLTKEDLSTEPQGYLILFYVDGDLAMNDAQDSTFSATIEAVANQTSG